MHIRKNPLHPIFIAISVLIVVSLASGCGTAVQTQPAPTETHGQSEPTKTPKKNNTPKLVKTPLSTDTPLPTDTPNIVSTSTPQPQGLTRNNPFPASTLVSAPNWDIQVLEVKRGDAAWQDIQAANSLMKPLQKAWNIFW